MTADPQPLPVRRVTVVTPCYNEEDNVRPLYEAVRAVFAAEPGYAYDHVFIDNCSRDATPAVLRKLAGDDPRVKVIFNARNFGWIRSPMYALLQADGDAAVMMACDFQDPPGVVPEFLRRWEEGAKVAIGVKTASDEWGPMYAVRSFYYKLVARMSDIDLPRHFTGFGLYDRRVLDELRKLDDPYPYFRGLIADIGFPAARVTFRQPTRKFGVTKSNFYRLYDVAMLGITNHSKVPLRLMTMGGFAMSAASLFMAFAYTAAKLLFWSYFTLGTAPIIITLFFVSSVQLFFLGVLGEYIGAIHTQVQRRPLVVERERLNFDVPAAAPTAAGESRP